MLVAPLIFLIAFPRLFALVMPSRAAASAASVAAMAAVPEEMHADEQDEYGDQDDALWHPQEPESPYDQHGKYQVY